jgi:hypothetical protein
VFSLITIKINLEILKLEASPELDQVSKHIFLKQQTSFVK